MKTSALITILLLCGCPFVTEGSYTIGESTGVEIETKLVGARCGFEVPCSSPAESDGTEAGDGSVGEDDESSSDGSDGESSSDGSSDGGSSSTGGNPLDSLYGPCDETCELSPIDFFDGCLCTVMCVSDEDCPGGMCNTEFNWCAQPCDDCVDGQICQTHEGLEIEFCVWPF